MSDDDTISTAVDKAIKVALNRMVDTRHNKAKGCEGKSLQCK